MAKSIFKKKLFGYSPADVTAYLEELNGSVSTELEDAEKTAELLRAECGELKKQIEALTEEIEKQKEEALHLSEIQNELEGKNAECETLRLSLSDAEERLSSLTSEYDSLNVRFTSLSAEAEEYTKSCREAGTVLMLAQSKADEITETAKSEAERIIAEARAIAQETVSRAKTEAAAYSVRVKSDADEYAVRIRIESDDAVEKNKEKVEFLIKRQRQLLAALQSQKSEIAKFYDETVSGITGSSGSHGDR